MAFNVTFGDHDLRATEETEVTFYNVQDYRVHGSWRPNLLLNDVAVIYLPEPIRYTRNNSTSTLSFRLLSYIVFSISCYSEHPTGSS